MNIVDLLVHKTHVRNLNACFFWGGWFLSLFSYFISIMQEKIESSTDILKDILKPVTDEEEEMSWPPKDPQSLILMEKVCCM